MSIMLKRGTSDNITNNGGNTGTTRKLNIDRIIVGTGGNGGNVQTPDIMNTARIITSGKAGIVQKGSSPYSSPSSSSSSSSTPSKTLKSSESLVKSTIPVNNSTTTPTNKQTINPSNPSNASKSTGASGSSDATNILKASLVKFFTNKENIDRFLPIINRTSPVSLRLLDYFCVNYSRSTQVVYMIMDKYFDVHSSYKNQLKTFSKKMFDPFRRNTRITIRYDTERFDTTLGQLCFFKWCLTHNVLDYVEKNIAAISEDMKKNSGKTPEENQNQTEKKRRTSRRRSAMNVTATRGPVIPGMETVIVAFD